MRPSKALTALVLVLCSIEGESVAPARAYAHAGRESRLALKKLSSPAPEFQMDLKDISVIGDTLWAVAEEMKKGSMTEAKPEGVSRGVVLRSTDAGATWERQLVKPDLFFSRILFINSETGWVIGGGGTIFRSADGGKSWTEQETRANSLLIDLQFNEAHRGWVLGVDGTVLRTEDGGASWITHKIEGKEDLYSLSFSDNLTGWVVGEKASAYQTTDGGATWQPRGASLVRLLNNSASNEVIFRAVKFINPKLGFIAAEVSSKESRSNARGILFKTTDGGQTWSANLIPGEIGIWSAEFVSEKETWALPGTRGVTHLAHTQDGGQRWSRVPLPASGSARRVHFSDSKHGWFIDHTDDLSSDRIFHTPDAGKTWIRIKVAARE